MLLAVPTVLIIQYIPRLTGRRPWDDEVSRPMGIQFYDVEACQSLVCTVCSYFVHRVDPYMTPRARYASSGPNRYLQSH